MSMNYDCWMMEGCWLLGREVNRFCMNVDMAYIAAAYFMHKLVGYGQKRK